MSGRALYYLVDIDNTEHVIDTVNLFIVRRLRESALCVHINR